MTSPDVITRAKEVLPLIRDSLDELFLCLDLRMLDSEGVWSVLRSLAAALHKWSPKIASDGVNPVINNEMKCVLGCYSL